MRRKIGILTFHHIANEGAILQAYCLAQKVAEVFSEYDVEIINYQSAAAEKVYFNLAFFSSKNPKTIYQRIQRYYRLRSFIAKHLLVSSQKLVSDDLAQAVKFLDGAYDAIVVGSDEIWKVETDHQIRPFPNIYWLRPEIHCKKIAYAASANKLAFRNLDSEKTQWMRDCLNAFDLLGVRDDHTCDFANYLKLTALERVHKVADPTLIWDVPTLDMKSYLSKCGLDFGKKILATTFAEKRFMPELCAHYKNQGYQIVALTAANSYADVNLAGKLNPFEWANAFRYFDVCCTNLFHGSIFSIKAGIPFVSFDYFNNPDYDTKMHCLLKEFSLLAHYLPMQGTLPTLKEIINQIDQAKENFNKEAVLRTIAQRNQIADQFFVAMREIIK